MNDSGLPYERSRDEFREPPAAMQSATEKRRSRVPQLDLGTKRLEVPEPTWSRIQSQWESVRRHLTIFADDHVFIQSTRAIGPSTLFHEDREFNRSVMEDLRPLHEAWYGGPLIGSACYGIRVYLPGSYLYSHVDTIETHAISSTICVAKKLDRAWPLWIRDGEHASEVELEPGEMLHYESARLEHGRPYPLVGEYYAGLFVHYRPIDWRVEEVTPAPESAARGLAREHYRE